jgi:hypothetical protein
MERLLKEDFSFPYMILNENDLHPLTPFTCIGQGQSEEVPGRLEDRASHNDTFVRYTIRIKKMAHSNRAL